MVTFWILSISNKEKKQMERKEKNVPLTTPVQTSLHILPAVFLASQCSLSFCWWLSLTILPCLSTAPMLTCATCKTISQSQTQRKTCPMLIKHMKMWMSQYLTLPSTWTWICQTMSRPCLTTNKLQREKMETWLTANHSNFSLLRDCQWSGRLWNEKLQMLNHPEDVGLESVDCSTLLPRSDTCIAVPKY